MVMLLIDAQGATNKPLMVDATGGDLYHKERFTNQFIGKDKLLEVVAGKCTPIAKRITASEAEANDWNLDVRRYVLSDDAQRLQKQLDNLPTQLLSEIVEFVRCQAVRSEEEGTTFLEANQADIDEIGTLARPKKQLLISESKHMNLAQKQQVLPGDILVTVKGNVGKVGLVTAPEDNWLAGQSFVILRLKSGSLIKDSTYLYRYLNSPMAQQALLRTASGSTVKILKMNDLKDLQVVIPTQSQIEEASDKQQQMVSLQQQITQLQQQIDALRHDDWLKL
jgi:type I restriction enzyme M protein